VLVLSRKFGEQIVVPEHNIVITVLEVRGGRVRLGVSAPEGVSVFRQEIWDRIKEFADPSALPAEPAPAPLAEKPCR
jgi:carbon storage regulator